jgi:hypothetical protein
MAMCVPDMARRDLGYLLMAPNSSRSIKSVLPHVKVGDAVAVFARDELGDPYLEGWAFIRAICANRPHHFRVRFRSERVVRTRFIDPASQREPKLSRALLRDFWRRNSSESFEEFFPKYSMCD